MLPLFVFGTLRHAPLLQQVAGAAPATRPAHLRDHAVLAVPGADYPVLRPVPGAHAEGLLVEGLDAAARGRIDFYEAIFGYHRAPVTVQGADGPVAAEVYLPGARAQTEATDGPWDLAAWCAAEAPLTCAVAAELLERRATDAAETLAALHPFIRARAWTRLGAAAAPAPTTLRHRAAPGDVEIRRDETPFNGFFRLKSFSIAARQFSGAMGPALDRECFVSFDAALVLPYDPRTDRVMCVEQLRYGPIWRGDPQPWTLEPIAVMLDAGETPEETARRETLEEAGLTLDALLPIAGAYPAPGYVTEYHHCFLGLAALDADSAGVGGLMSESENIRSHVLSFDAAMALLDAGEINVSPLAMMLLWLARKRDALRAAAT
jgi:nudix-type nucleoside diphosphatase (YffH/AdpP family)